MYGQSQSAEIDETLIAELLSLHSPGPLAEPHSDQKTTLTKPIGRPKSPPMNMPTIGNSTTVSR